MSDADYIYKHFGIGWLDGTANYGSDKKPLTTIERFKHRRSTRTKIETEHLQQLAAKLVGIKDQLKLLQATERQIKSVIFDNLQAGEYLEVKQTSAISIIEKNRTTKAAILPRQRTFEFIEERYGTIAAEELLEHCLSQYKSKETIYVRKFPSENTLTSTVNQGDDLMASMPEEKPNFIDLDDDELPFA